MKIALETPFERMKDAVLKSHHMTEAQYDSLNGPANDAITKEIQDAVKRSLTGNPTSPADKGIAADLQP